MWQKPICHISFFFLIILLYSFIFFHLSSPNSREPESFSFPSVIKAPRTDSLKVSLNKPSHVADSVSILEWSGSALDEGDEASKWFTKYIGKPSRLVRFNAASETRPVDSAYAPGHNIMFSEEYPFMLISQGSLDALNKLMKEPVPIAGPEPKETLIKVRPDKALRPNGKQQNRMYFGLDLVWKETSEGKSKMVKVGDPIFVLHKVSSVLEAAT